MEKERRTKALLLSTLVVVVATLSIAFAAMSRTLSINGIGKMDTASWSVYFKNLSDAKITRGAEEVGKPKISDDKGIVQDINVKLSNPKDEISYTVDIVNDGTIDAEITMIKDIELTDVQKKVFEFKVTYTDTGEILRDGDILPKDTTKNITISIKFKDDITEFDLPTESQTINLSYQITYTQYDGSEIVIEPDGGDINTGKAVLKSVNMEEIMSLPDPTSYHVFDGPIARNSVESLTFLSSNAVPTEYEDNSWDASEAKDGSVMAWYEDSDSNGLNEVYIGGNGKIYAPSDSSALLGVFVSLKEINNINLLDTSDVTNMWYMFLYCSLSSLNLSSFDTSNVTNMAYMFYTCTSLTSLDLSNFNTSKVTDMSDMFSDCSSLTSLDLSSFNTSNVTNMESIFYTCTSLTSLDLSSFDTSEVTDMTHMFSSCSSLTSLDLSNFNTQNVTDMGIMFDCCESLTSLDLSNFNTSKVTDMSSMFSNCSSLTSLDLSSFDTSNVTDMSFMFHRCSSLTSLDLRKADFSNVTEYYWSMFNDTPTTIQIIVRDETQRTWLTTHYSNLTNVVLPSKL